MSEFLWPQVLKFFSETFVEIFEFFRFVSLMVKAVIERDQMMNQKFQRAVS